MPEIRAIVAVGDAVSPYLLEISIDGVIHPRFQYLLMASRAAVQCHRYGYLRKRNLGSPIPPAGGRKADTRV
jgi:hypothetical protein